MIAIHLLPFPFRGAKAPFNWIFHIALSKVGAEVAYILSADYLDADEQSSNLSVAARRSLARASYSLIPDKEMRIFADSYPTRALAWHAYLTKEVPQLTRLYENALAGLPSIDAIGAVITWCNCPSLVKACQRLKIPVIHQELGSLRPPGYLSTIYFDSSGVNGNTEAEARYFRLDAEKQTLPVFSSQELLNIFSATELDREVQFKRGVALQVEDDSNILAYANAFNSTALISKALEDVTPAEVLVRDHPAAHFAYRQRNISEPARDESPSTAGFLGKIEHLYTINSSIGVEALLHGIPVTCLGEAPYKFVTATSIDSAEFTRRLSFYCLNYLVPAEFLFDEKYILWRLGSPSELEIQAKHLSAHASQFLPPVFFAQVYFDLGNGYSEDKSIIRAIKTGKQQLVFSGFPQDAPIHALRLDPLNDHATVKIENFFVLDEDAAISCSISSTNADYTEAAGLYFMHGDPSVFIEIPGGRITGLKQVVVDLDVIACGQSEVKSEFGRRSIDALTSLQQVIAQRDQAATERDQVAADRDLMSLDRDRVVADLQKVIAQRDQAATERDQVAADRDLVSLDKDRVVADLQKVTAQRDQAATERDQVAADRDLVSLDRDRVVADLQKVTAQRDQAATERDQAAADGALVSLDRDRVVADLQQVTAQRDQVTAERDQVAAERELVLLDRDRVVADMQQVTAQCNQVAAERDQLAADRALVSLDRDRVVADIQQMAAQRDRVAAERDKISADQRIISFDRDRALADLQQMAVQCDQAVTQRDQVSEERNALATTVHLLKNTFSWRITGPLRFIASKLQWTSRQFERETPQPESWSDNGTHPVAIPADAHVTITSEARESERHATQLVAQLFVDAGDGFSEEGSLRKPVLAGKQQVVFGGFVQDSAIQSLRIDPVNDHTIVRIDRVLLTNQGGEQALGTVVALNAAHADATGCWFTHDDPQFLIEVPEQVREGLKEVSIDMEVLAVGPVDVAQKLRSRQFGVPEPVKAFEDGVNDALIEAFEVLSGNDADLPPVSLERDPAKLIAFYLPQYHRIAENSEWWGPGFTEWTNVVTGKPNYEGHSQPHLPRELGFYDLSNVGVMREQAEMAKLYGVHAFCFYYYWFSGRRILEKPLENFLNSDIDFKYCLCWANENWTRTWDGDTRSVLMEQKYSDSDPIEFINSLLPYFNDRRYIQVDGKPMLVVYRAKEIPDVKAVFATWKNAVEAAGFAGLHINVVDFYDISHPDEVDADALTEFPPHKFNGVGSNPDVMPTITNRDFQGSIVDYAKVIEQSVGRGKPNFTLYRAAMPSWDNTARRQNTPTILHGASPTLFGGWMRYLRAYTREHFAGDEDNFIFVNAWNEWGEGCHLEPDQTTGLGNLEALAKSAWFNLEVAFDTVREQTLDATKQSTVARHHEVRKP